MAEGKKKEPVQTVLCPACGGRKELAWGTEMFKCGRCDGKGTVRA